MSRRPPDVAPWHRPKKEVGHATILEEIPEGVTFNRATPTARIVAEL